MMLKISKSAFDGTLGKQEFLRELRTRLIRGTLKIEEVEKIIKEYYEWRPKAEQEPKNNNQLWVIKSEENKRTIEALPKEN